MESCALSPSTSCNHNGQSFYSGLRACIAVIFWVPLLFAVWCSSSSRQHCCYTLYRKMCLQIQGWRSGYSLSFNLSSLSICSMLFCTLFFYATSLECGWIAAAVCPMLYARTGFVPPASRRIWDFCRAGAAPAAYVGRKVSCLLVLLLML